MATLKMWNNDVDYVIAPTAERASELAIQQYGAGAGLDPEAYAPDAFTEMNSDRTFTIHEDSNRQVTKPIREWIAEHGEGWFATTEY